MKDPAFNFYSDNFLSGTMFFTDEQVGKYIRLLCAQHQTGHLEEKHMIMICKTYDEDIWRKFKKDDNGLFYNERLENEILKRKLYSESRSRNKKGKKIKQKKEKKTSKTYDNHMGNGNGIGIDNYKNKYEYYIKSFNEIKKSNYRENDKIREKFNARIKEGYTVEQILTALKSAMKVKFHIESGLKYLTPEFFTRPDKIDMYLNSNSSGTGIIHEETPEERTLRLFNEMEAESNGKTKQI